MCKTLKVLASGCYGWLSRPVCQRRQANITLTAQIREAFIASDETYGMPRIRAELMNAGIVASRKHVAALMRQEHMRGVNCRSKEQLVTHFTFTRRNHLPGMEAQGLEALTNEGGRPASSSWRLFLQNVLFFNGFNPSGFIGLRQHKLGNMLTLQRH